MKGAVDELVELAKALPGFGLVFLIASVAQGYLNGDAKGPSVGGTFRTAILCLFLYKAAASLDDLYDIVYGPKDKWKWLRRLKVQYLWRFDALEAARDAAAKALLGPVDDKVADYASATAHGYVGKRPLPSLYTLCSTAATPTEVWRRRIAPKIDVSKAARTVLLFALIALFLIEITLLQDLTAAYLPSLGFLARTWFQALLALVALLIYVALRVLHHLELFHYVATNVTHVPVKGNKKAAVIFDVVLSRAQGA